MWPTLHPNCLQELIKQHVKKGIGEKANDWGGEQDIGWYLKANLIEWAKGVRVRNGTVTVGVEQSNEKKKLPVEEYYNVMFLNLQLSLLFTFTARKRARELWWLALLATLPAISLIGY